MLQRADERWDESRAISTYPIRRPERSTPSASSASLGSSILGCRCRTISRHGFPGASSSPISSTSASAVRASHGRGRIRPTARSAGTSPTPSITAATSSTERSPNDLAANGVRENPYFAQSFAPVIRRCELLRIIRSRSTSIFRCRSSFRGRRSTAGRRLELVEPASVVSGSGYRAVRRHRALQ